MPRQQTLRASVDWSHELLDENERVLFRRLAVFAGSWTLDAVEDVCSGEGLERMAILDLLTSLVDKSLVIVDEQPTRLRYRLLQTVRHYAFDRLVDAGEPAAVRGRHRDHYVRRAEQIAPHLEASGQGVWLDALDDDAANFAAALDHAASSDEESALRLCVSLTVWWKLRGRFVLADAAYMRALDAGSEELAALRARVLWARGYLLAYAARFEEAVAVELEALEAAQRLAEMSTAARALDVLGTIQMFPDPTGAREGLEQARELALISGDDWCFVDVCQILATTLLLQSDPRAEDFNEGLGIIERTGYAEFAAWHSWGIGNVRQIQGRDEEALALYDRAIAMADAVGEPVSSGITHGSAAILRSDRGDAEGALADLGIAMERSVATGAGLALPLLTLATAYGKASAGMLAEGRAALRRYIEQFDTGDLYGTAFALYALGRAELALGELDDAFEHAGGAFEIADGGLSNPALAAAARRVLPGWRSAEAIRARPNGSHTRRCRR
jgi:tetratricopeptide (TPR) repeat protein